MTVPTIDPACAVCRGACCSSIVLPFRLDEVPVDIRAQLRLRGQLDEHGGWRLDAPCRHLTRRGLCGVYEERPDICRKFEVGSPACRAAVRANRAPAVAVRIMQVLDRKR